MRFLRGAVGGRTWVGVGWGGMYPDPRSQCPKRSRDSCRGLAGGTPRPNALSRFLLATQERRWLPNEPLRLTGMTSPERIKLQLHDVPG